MTKREIEGIRVVAQDELSVLPEGLYVVGDKKPQYKHIDRMYDIDADRWVKDALVVLLARVRQPKKPPHPASIERFTTREDGLQVITQWMPVTES